MERRPGAVSGGTDALLQAITEDGELLLSPEEAEAARQRAEGENKRLRLRLARYEDPEGSGEGPILTE